ncbi:MAG TPA: hypothetical protein VLZ81_11295 [Blastocatellia bacterium]|nr:hypothetical protein [Blastocatellia bacterium]
MTSSRQATIKDSNVSKPNVYLLLLSPKERTNLRGLRRRDFIPHLRTMAKILINVSNLDIEAGETGDGDFRKRP